MFGGREFNFLAGFSLKRNGLSSYPTSLRKVRLPERTPLGFTFSPAGFLFIYHLGVYVYLRDHGYITPDVPISGGSAGSLIVLLDALRLPDEVIFDVLYKIMNDCHTKGTHGRLARVLQKVVRPYITKEGIKMINERPQPGTIIYTAVTLFGMNPVRATTFKNEDDLMECILASCNIPYYSCYNPFVKVRDHYGIDGYFADAANLGCMAMPQVETHVRILPFDASVVIKGEPLTSISPALCNYDKFLSKQDIASFKKYVNSHPVPKSYLDRAHGTKGAVTDPAANGDLPTIQSSNNFFQALETEFDKIEGTKDDVNLSKTPEINEITKFLYLSDPKTIEEINTNNICLAQDLFNTDSTTIDNVNDFKLDEKGVFDLNSDISDLDDDDENCVKRRVDKKDEIDESTGLPYYELSPGFVNRTLSLKSWMSSIKTEVLQNKPAKSFDGKLKKTDFKSTKRNGSNSTKTLASALNKKLDKDDDLSESGMPENITMSWRGIIKRSLRPITDPNEVVALFELGRADAFRWAMIYKRNSMMKSTLQK